MKRLIVDPQLKKLLSLTIMKELQSPSKWGFLEKTTMWRHSTFRDDIDFDKFDFKLEEEICLSSINLEGPVLSLGDVWEAINQSSQNEESLQ